MDDAPFLIPLQLVGFWGFLVAFTAARNIKVLVSGCPSIDMHGIIHAVKFDGGLFISVMRNKQMFEKMDVKSSHFQIEKSEF
jgi:hypothetical protein